MGNDLHCNNPATNLQQIVATSESQKAANRVEDLAGLGVHLLRGGLDELSISNYLKYYAEGRYQNTYLWNPGGDKKLVDELHLAKTHAMREWFEPSKKTFAKLVEDWVATKKRQFTLQSGYNELRLQQVGEKSHFRSVLIRLLKKGIIKRVGDKAGVYRTIEQGADEEDWQNATQDSVPLWLPFDLSDMVIIPPGSIVLIAGAPGSGKTATLMNIAYENMNKFDIHYFSSEIGPSAFKSRAEEFKDITVDQWDVKFYRKGGQFEDHVKSGTKTINIIDYLEIHSDFFRVGEHLNNIHANLGDSIAIIALQKNPGVDTGRGGWHTIEKPELAIALDHGQAKVVKVRNFKKDIDNPIYKIYTYDILDGCRFKKKIGWHHPAQREPEF